MISPNHPTVRLAWTAALAAGLGGAPLLADIPDRPEDLTFEPLTFEPPRAEDFRHDLPGGVTAFMMPG